MPSIMRNGIRSIDEAKGGTKEENFVYCSRIIHAVCRRFTKFVGEKDNMGKTNITKADTEGYGRIMAIWESSVKTIHDFPKTKEVVV